MDATAVTNGHHLRAGGQMVVTFGLTSHGGVKPAKAKRSASTRVLVVALKIAHEREVVRAKGTGDVHNLDLRGGDSRRAYQHHRRDLITWIFDQHSDAFGAGPDDRNDRRQRNRRSRERPAPPHLTAQTDDRRRALHPSGILSHNCHFGDADLGVFAESVLSALVIVLNVPSGLGIAMVFTLVLVPVIYSLLAPLALPRARSHPPRSQATRGRGTGNQIEYTKAAEQPPSSLCRLSATEADGDDIDLATFRAARRWLGCADANKIAFERGH